MNSPPNAKPPDVTCHFKMTLPSKIDIQIIDTKGRPNLLENVLFGLKIFISEDSWHNYSVFKSNSAGHITLTKQDIIDNTELKWETNILSTNPTKFELYVWEGQHTDDIIKMTKRLLQLYNDKDFIQQDLKQHEIADSKIPHALEVTNSKAIEDKAFYQYIKDAVNSSVKVDTNKIEGVWSDDLQKSYEFIIQ
jgi:hypothetical protein